MIGGEHKKERYSEQLENATNQPKNRGYIPGTQPKTQGYTSNTLQGNWYEERANAAFYDGKPIVPSTKNANWTTSYREMTAQEKLIGEKVAPKFDQETLVDIEDRAKQSFPGHQPQADPHAAEIASETFKTVSQTTYKPPTTVTTTSGQPENSVRAPVLGHSATAQGKGVLHHLRQAVLSRMPGQNPYPGNVGRTLRGCLREASTDPEKDLVNAAELRAGFSNAGVVVSEPESVALVRHFDHKGFGTISATEVVTALRGELNIRREQLIKDVYALLVSLSPDKLVRVSNMVGLVDVKYVPAVLEGNATMEEALADFEEVWEAREPNALVKLERFLFVYGDASFEIPHEGDFERFMRNTWHLSGGTGNCTNTSCRRMKVVHLNGRVSIEEAKNDLAIKGELTEVYAQLVENLASQGIKDVKSITLL